MHWLACQIIINAVALKSLMSLNFLARKLSNVNSSLAANKVLSHLGEAFLLKVTDSDGDSGHSIQSFPLEELGICMSIYCTEYT